jgi:two-component system, OmpR family, response regulator MprA
VVDDERTIRELLRQALQDDGYRVVAACDGLDALDQLDRFRPMLILLDLSMPRMDGLAFSVELERRGLRPAIPLLVMSASPRASDRAAQAGAEIFVAKPFDLDEILATVAQLLGALNRR